MSLPDPSDIAREEYDSVIAEQAIKEFTSERLCSYYLENPDLLKPAFTSLREGQALHAGEHYGAAMVYYATSIELFITATVLKPVVYGLVHHQGLASIVMETLAENSSGGRAMKLLKLACSELACIPDLQKEKRDGAKKPLLEEIGSFQRDRSQVVHEGALGTAAQAQYGETLALAVYDVIVQPMIHSLGLMVTKRLTIARQGSEPNPIIEALLARMGELPVAVPKLVTESPSNS